MKNLIITILFIFLFSCSQDVQEKEIEVQNIEKIKITENVIDIPKDEVLVNENIITKDKKYELPEEKELDVKFYSQFPLDISTWKKYEEPYQNFCEEASLLNWYYYLTWKDVSLKEYDRDLLRLKDLEDSLFEWWYKHTSLKETLKVLSLFQWNNQIVFWKIIENPTVDDIKENIAKWNLIITPLYWKWLSNDLFSNWWPVYHNLLIKGYKSEIFITNEVWVSKWDWFKYKINNIMENIHDYDKSLYPDNFTNWKKEILILYK